MLVAIVLPPVLVAAVLVFASARQIREDKELYSYDLVTQSVELLANNLSAKVAELQRRAAALDEPGGPFLSFKDVSAGEVNAPVVSNASQSGKAVLKLRFRKGGVAKWALLRPKQLLSLVRQGPALPMVVNRSGEIIAHPDPRVVVAHQGASRLLGQLRLFQKGAVRLGTKEVHQKDGAALAAFARIPGGLAVVQTIPKTQVTNAAMPLIRAAAITSAITVLVMLFLALLLSRRLVQPLREMARQAEAIGRGEFDVTLEAEPSSQGAGEVATLAQSLRKMSLSLKRREEELKQVQQRLLQSERINAAGRVIGAIAQELAEPLETSQALAEKVHSAVSGLPKLRVLSDSLGEELGRAAMMLQKLRRLDVGESAAEAKEIEADLAVADALVAARPMLEQRKISAVLDPEFEPRPVHMPERSLQNALLDVCHFVAQGAKERTNVTVSIANHELHDGGPGVAITFTYVGDPMSKDEREALLSPLEAVERGGTLALAVAAAAVTEGGGSLSLEPTAEGNQIRMIFPAEERQHSGEVFVVDPLIGMKGPATREVGLDDAEEAMVEWGDGGARPTKGARAAPKEGQT
ncbi:MAG: HAMP domain-containing protein [Deltaproteobacteria bacterium]|nr:HAMP domain-containing protein [Deltaproteobacteria bacterium]